MNNLISKEKNSTMKIEKIETLSDIYKYTL